jgi:hypothetical protein
MSKGEGSFSYSTGEIVTPRFWPRFRTAPCIRVGEGDEFHRNLERDPLRWSQIWKQGSIPYPSGRIEQTFQGSDDQLLKCRIVIARSIGFKMRKNRVESLGFSLGRDKMSSQLPLEAEKWGITLVPKSGEVEQCPLSFEG